MLVVVGLRIGVKLLYNEGRLCVIQDGHNQKEKYLDCCDVTLWASPRQEQRELSQNRY